MSRKRSAPEGTLPRVADKCYSSTRESEFAIAKEDGLIKPGWWHNTDGFLPTFEWQCKPTEPLSHSGLECIMSSGRVRIPDPFTVSMFVPACLTFVVLCFERSALFHLYLHGRRARV